MSFQRALLWSIFWIGLSLATSLVIWEFYSHEHALAFLAGYTIEKALSVDNLFVFLMLFTHFKVNSKHSDTINCANRCRATLLGPSHVQQTRRVHRHTKVARLRDEGSSP